MFGTIYPDDQNVVTPRRPRNCRDRYRNGDIERRPLWASGRSPNFKRSGEPEWLFSLKRGRNRKGIPVHIFNRKFGGMFLVALVPIDLNGAGDREWLWKWPGLVPGPPQKEEQTFADLRAIRQKYLCPHALRVITGR
jgi:hypothetical protein